MSFASWWKTSSAKAGEDYDKLRFDDNEINEFRHGLLSASAREKFRQRLKRYYKIASVLLGGCFALLLLVISPIICIFGYGIYASPPQTRSPFGWFLILGCAFLIVCYAVIAVILWNLRRKINVDLKGNRVGCEQGSLKIVVKSRQSPITVVFSINDVEFKFLEDAAGAEIKQQFMNLFNQNGDSRTTIESYRVYYLPQSKLILHYEPI